MSALSELARRRRPARSRGAQAFLVAPAAAALLLSVGLVRPAAVTATHSTIWVHAASTGPIVVGSAGTGYVAWESSIGSGDPAYFCKIPKGGTCTHAMKLPIPNGASWDDYRINQPFPVLGGKAGVVSVVAPSYDYSDVVVWTSHNNGASFGEPQAITSAHYDGTGTDDVLRTPDSDAPHYPDYFTIASSNPGLFYDFTGIGAIGALDPPAGFEQDTSAVKGAVAGSTLGFGKTVDPGPSQSTQTVEAFFTNADTPQLDFFWSPLPGVSGEPGSLEHGPTHVANGIDPRLAGGPDGLFLVSADYVASPSDSSKPLHLDVRKWDPTTHTFGHPTFVADVPNDIDATDTGGFAEDASTGVLTVIWPTKTSGGHDEMAVWTSATKGASFSGPTDVAPFDYGYSGPARVATVGDRGFATFQDAKGLHLVDLAHL